MFFNGGAGRDLEGLGDSGRATWEHAHEKGQSPPSSAVCWNPDDAVAPKGVCQASISLARGWEGSVQGKSLDLFAERSYRN